MKVPFLSHLFSKIEHDAQPLVKAAESWAKAEGLVIVQEVRAEILAKSATELQALVAAVLGRVTGVPVGFGAPVTESALELVTTFLAREKAQLRSGGSLRSAVLNAGIEQALLLFKGQIGDTITGPVH